MAGGISIKKGGTPSEVSEVKYVSGSSVTDVSAVWEVKGGNAIQIFPKQTTIRGSITLSDSSSNVRITDTNGNDLSSYSLSGTVGSTPTFTFRVIPVDGYQFNAATDSAASENSSHISISESFDNANDIFTYTITGTIPNDDANDQDIEITANSIITTYTTGGNITGTLTNETDYTPKTWSVSGAPGSTETGQTIATTTKAGFGFGSTDAITVTPPASGISNVQKTISANKKSMTITWTETVGNSSSNNNNIVLSGGATDINFIPSVSLGASDTNADTLQNVTLTASATDEDGDTLTYSWSSNDATNCPITSANSSTRTVTRSTSGSCVYTVEVSDGTLTASSNVTVSYNVPTFTCSDWTGSFSVDDEGNVTATNGNASGVSNIVENCGDNSDGCSNLSCSVTSYTLTTPSSGNWNNLNTNISCSVTHNLSQPFGGINWTSDLWTGSVSVLGNGTISLTQGNATSISSNPTSYPNNDTCSSVQRQPAITLGTPSSGYCNSNSTIFYIPTLSQPSNKPDWGASDWTGGVSVASNGQITCSQGNAQSCTVLTSNFSANNTCNSITRSGIQVRVVAPSGECNAGSNVTVSGLSASQPQSNNNEYTFSDWNGTFSVNSAGTVTCTDGNSDGCSTNPSSFSANTGCSTISRSATATIDVPSGYCNSSGTVSGPVSASQPGSGVNWDSSLWTGSCSADSDGDVDCSQGNATSVSVIGEDCNGNSGCSDNTCTVTAQLGVPSGYCNSGGTINYVHTVTQAAGGVDLTCSSVNFSVNIVAAGTYTTDYSSSVVSGTPSFSPTSFPTVSVNTNRTVTGTFTPSSSYCNSNTTIDCDASDIQEATQSNNCTTWRFTKTSGFFTQWSYTTCSGFSSSVNCGSGCSSTTACVRTGTTPTKTSGQGTQQNLNTTCT